MGVSRSKAVVETNVVNESIFETLNKTQSSLSAQVINDQNFTVSGIKAYGCDLSIGQTINADVKVMQTFTQEDTTDLLTAVVNDVEQKLKNESSRETGFLGVSGFDSKSTAAKTSILNKVKKSITSETINDVQAKVTNGQKLLVEKLVIDRCGMSVYLELGLPPPESVLLACINAEGKCEMNQDLVIRFVAEQLGSKITKIINEDQLAIDLRNEVSAVTVQKAKGLDDLLKAITGPYAIASAVCFGILMIACAVIFLSPSGQRSINKAANTGSNIARARTGTF